MINILFKKYSNPATFLAKFFIFMALMVCSAARAEQTPPQKIGNIEVQISGGSGPGYYFRPFGYGGWGAPSCPAANYIYLSMSTTGAKDLYQAAVIAKALDKNVTFFGTCSNNSYFIPIYIIVEQ